MAHHLWLDLPNVDPTDSAAKFITANALKDLAYYKFEREAQFDNNYRDSDKTAFYVIDLAPHRQNTLDTRSCCGPQASVSDKSEVLHSLFSQVPSLTVFRGRLKIS